MGSWADTTDLEKLLFGVRAIKLLGGSHATAFSLNLNPLISEQTRQNPDWLRRAIVRRVGAATPFLMALGAADDRIHCHGAFAACDADEANTVGCHLEAAAGDWASGRGGAYQLHVQPLGGDRSPDGWALYLFRNIAEARQVTDGRRLWSMTNAARRTAKDLHKVTRQLVNSTSHH